jgi:hypothetical protein
MSRAQLSIFKNKLEKLISDKNAELERMQMDLQDSADALQQMRVQFEELVREKKSNRLSVQLTDDLMSELDDRSEFSKRSPREEDDLEVTMDSVGGVYPPEVDQHLTDDSMERSERFQVANGEVSEMDSLEVSKDQEEEIVDVGVEEQVRGEVLEVQGEFLQEQAGDPSELEGAAKRYWKGEQLEDDFETRSQRWYFYLHLRLIPNFV